MVNPLRPSAAPSGATGPTELGPGPGVVPTGSQAAPRPNGHGGRPAGMPGSFAQSRPDGQRAATSGMDSLTNHFAALEEQASMDRLSLMPTSDNPMPRLNGSVVRFPSLEHGDELDDESKHLLDQHVMRQHMTKYIEDTEQKMLETIKKGVIKSDDDES